MRGKVRGGERGLLLAVSPHSNGRCLMHRSDRHTQIDRESCSAGGRYSPHLFPCLLVYKRRWTSKSHISMLRPHDGRLLVRPVICPRRKFIIHKQRTTNWLPFTWVTVRPEVVYIRRSDSVQIYPDRLPISVRARIGSNSIWLYRQHQVSNSR